MVRASHCAAEVRERMSLFRWRDWGSERAGSVPVTTHRSGTELRVELRLSVWIQGLSSDPWTLLLYPHMLPKQNFTTYLHYLLLISECTTMPCLGAEIINAFSTPWFSNGYYSLLVKSTSSWPRVLGFESWQCHLLVMCSWWVTQPLHSVYLLACKVQATVAPPSWGGGEEPLWSD